MGKIPRNYWNGTSDTETLLSSIELQGFENTLEALLQSAKVKDELTNSTDVDSYFNNLEKDGLSVNQITYELLADGIRSFLESYNSVVDRIKNKIIKYST